MMSLPPSGPLAIAMLPIESTIVVIGAPGVMAAVALAVAVAGVMCVALVRARRGRGRLPAPPRMRSPQVALPYASAGRAR